MKTKHTSGEWIIDDRMAQDKHARTFWYSIRNTDRNTIADVKGRHCGIKNSEAEANVRLIAEAPELLKTLIELQKRFIENGDMTGHLWSICEQAIKKAS